MKIIITLVLFVLMSTSQNVSAQPVVNICDDDGEWAPYAYHPRVNGNPEKSKIVGYAVDLVDEISKLTELNFSYTFTNWKRCNYYVDNFDKSNKFEIFINGGFTLERAHKYYVTAPIYRTHEGAFYSKIKYPEGLGLQQPSDLSRYKICGIYGHDYSGFAKKYNLPADTTLHQNAKSTETVMQMIVRSRCDIFISSLEPIYGGETIGKYKIPESISSVPIPGMKTTSFHIFITKKSPRSFELLTKINQAILILENNGVSQKMLDEYFPSNP